MQSKTQSIAMNAAAEVVLIVTIAGGLLLAGAIGLLALPDPGPQKLSRGIWRLTRCWPNPSL